MNTPLRHEFKHLVNSADTLALRNRLTAALPRDTHAGPDGCYQVRSLYFDNYRDTALQEKIDGVNQREKFRLRFYGTETGWIRLEKKTKQYSLCGKQSAQVNRAESERIIAGDIDWLSFDHRPVLRDLGVKMRNQLLRPKTIVEYTREAFVFPPGNVRITLDSAIRTGMQSTAFFELDCPLVLVNQPGLTVLEVKYDAFLPDLVRDMVQLGERQASAVSKYAACRII